MTSKLLKYSKQIILNITTEGVHYMELDGTKNFIDFQICRKNWLVYITTSSEFSSVNVNSVAKSKCIGWRDITAHPPFIEFFTEPRTRFEFSDWERWSDWFLRGKTHKDFHSMCDALTKVGWSTYDLS